MKSLRKYEGNTMLFDARTVLLQGQRKPRNKTLIRMLGNLGSYDDGASEIKFWGEHPFQWVPNEFTGNLLGQKDPQFIKATVEDAEDFYYGN